MSCISQHVGGLVDRTPALETHFFWCSLSKHARERVAAIDTHGLVQAREAPNDTRRMGCTAIPCGRWQFASAQIRIRTLLSH